MSCILGRLLVRVAVLTASFAWLGFVFTQTVGDPDRGERIALAVLADPAARAEVTAPVTNALMATTGIPPEQRPLVEGQVDRYLRDPVGARTFVDPFAGAWARLLGEDDPRPTEVDLGPYLAQLAATAGAPDGVVVPDRVPVPGVPLPRTELGWMDAVRSIVAAAVLPLALVSVGLFASAFAIGDRRRVLRRLGVWAILAGGSWVAIPPLLVWAARRWAPGADAVVAVALDEASSGLLAVAIALVVVGVAAIVSSFALVPRRAPVPAPRRPVGARPRRRGPSPAAQAPARPRRSEPTAEIPAVVRGTPAAGDTTRVGASSPAGGEVTGELPAARRPATRPAEADADPLWDYYSS